MSNGLPQRLEELNKQFCVVRVKGKTLICKTALELEFMTVQSFKDWMANNQILGKKDKPISVANAWLAWPNRRQYEGVVLIPKGDVPNGHLNIYRGWGVTPKQGKWPLLENHIYEVLANGDEHAGDYMVWWCAWALQNMEKCAEAVLVLQGDKGAGKGVLGNGLCKIFGRHGVHIAEESLLTGRFKGHMLECLLLFADEAVWGGNRKGAGGLQGLITESPLHIEQKFCDAIPMTNRLHIMMAADKEWVIPAGPHERRYAVFKVSNRYSQDMCPDAERINYFNALHHELYKGGGLEAFAWDLLNCYDLKNWHPRQIYKTAALRHQQKLGMSPLQEWFEDVLEVGELPRGAGVKPQPPLKDLQANEVTTEALKHHAAECVPKLRDLSNQTLATFLQGKEGQGAWRWKTRDFRGWAFPPLQECRRLWERKFGPREWEPRKDWGEPVAEQKNTSATVIPFKS